MDKQQRVNEIGQLVTDYLYHGGCCEKTMTFILFNSKGLTGNDSNNAMEELSVRREERLRLNLLDRTARLGGSL